MEKATTTTPSRSAASTHPTNWKTKHHTYKLRLSKPLTNANGEALVLINAKKCKEIGGCSWSGRTRTFVVDGHAHRLVYLTRAVRRAHLGKRAYTRVITDSGQELLAKDKRGHWRRVRAW